MFFKGLVDGGNGFSWMDWIRFFLWTSDLMLLAFQDIVTLGFSVIPDLMVFRRLAPQRNGFKWLLLNFGD
jgi:hypothetical protein